MGAMARAGRLFLVEPFRLFFPLGLRAGVGGVMLWPLYYGHWVGFNPLEAHPRMMVEGCLGAFVLGFLGTAFPRLAGNRPWHVGEFLLLLGLWAGVVGSAASGRVAAADGVFAVMLAVLFCGLVLRWVSVPSVPPTTVGAASTSMSASSPTPTTSGNAGGSMNENVSAPALNSAAATVTSKRPQFETRTRRAVC